MKKVEIVMGLDSRWKRAYLSTHVCTRKDVVLTDASPETVVRTLAGMVEGTVFIDAVSGSRTKRRSLFHRIKGADLSVQVVAVYVMATLVTLGETQTADGRTRLKYLGIQVPRIGVDCDAIVVAGESFFQHAVGNPAGVQELFEAATPNLQRELQRVFEPHESVWHKEDIDVHIELAVANAPEDLKRVALFHDLGKSVAKQPKKTDPRYCSYHQHERVSAQYFLNYLWFWGGGLTEENLSDLEVVNQHMAGHEDIRYRTLRKNWLDDTTLHRIQNFAHVDSVSKITD